MHKLQKPNLYVSHGSSGQGSGQRRDMSKVKWFFCKKFGHYVG
jgi:hypothetical protein